MEAILKIDISNDPKTNLRRKVAYYSSRFPYQEREGNKELSLPLVIEIYDNEDGLFKSIDYTMRAGGLMVDSQGNAVEFTHWKSLVNQDTKTKEEYNALSLTEKALYEKAYPAGSVKEFDYFMNIDLRTLVSDDAYTYRDVRHRMFALQIQAADAKGKFDNIT